MRRRSVVLAVLLLSLVACAPAQEEAAAQPGVPATGPWRAWLDSPGGELPFRLELAVAGHGALEAWLVNGPERIAVERVTFESGLLGLHIDHYDARVEARLDASGRRLDGFWTKRNRGAESWAHLDFHAVAGEAPRFAPDPGADAAEGPSVDGRWAVEFESDEVPAVGLFETAHDGTVTGTVLTATGDYRYLAGSLDGQRLRLSCFDGSHAFLFDARLQDDGSLAGDFWSRDSWHETWVARRDPGASLPDPFAMSVWREGTDLADLVFPGLDGLPRSLADPAFAGAARIVQIFGSWCPNCNDATRYLVELHERYAERGLSIVGLAFEHTGDFERDAGQVRVYAQHHGIPYPLLVAGSSVKEQAAAAMPALDRIRAYPTTVFLHADGRVRAVHTGFAGPATGPEHDHLRERFEALIEELLSEP